MKILLDNNGCIMGIATDGDIPGSIAVPDTVLDGIPLEHRGGQCLRCYRWDGAQVTLDADALTGVMHGEATERIRMRRIVECFAIIDRGRLWYESLTQEQLAELAVWREAWLAAPASGVIPIIPEWIE